MVTQKVRKKFPTKMKTFKIPLEEILKKNKRISDKITEVVYRITNTTMHLYHFMRLYSIDCFNKGINIPEFNVGTVKMAFKSLSKESAGPKPQGTNKILYNKFKVFYSNVYSELGLKTKIDGTNLGTAFDYISTEIVTSIENNIKNNYKKYIKKYIFTNFYHNDKEKIKNLTVVQKKQYNKDLYSLYRFISEEINEVDPKYQNWINVHKNNIIPKEGLSDIKMQPQKYLKYMIYMTQKTEQFGKYKKIIKEIKDGKEVEIEREIETKLYQFFPLQTSFIPRYVPIDTKLLIELFVDMNKKYYLDNVTDNKNGVWKRFFNLKHKIFTQNKKNYTFDFRISTNGVTASLQFLHNSFVNSKIQMNINKREGRNSYKKLNKDKTAEEKEYNRTIKKNKQINDKKKKEELYIKEFKEKSKEERKKILENSKEGKEFPYIENMTKSERIKEKKKIYIDPGKSCLLTMIDDNDNILKYTNKQRIKETERCRTEHRLQNYKDKKGISKVELELSKYNSKTCNMEKFKEYVINKNKAYKKISKTYEDSIFRKLKWHVYINTKRSENKLLDTIEEKYGKDIIIIIGDWSEGEQMSNFISTKGIGLKRKIKERFEVYHIDEYRTSCLSYITEMRCENLKVKEEKEGKSINKSIHSVLTYKMLNNRKGCINRDINAVKNMRKIVSSVLTTGERPYRYKRENKIINISQVSINDKKLELSNLAVHDDILEIKIMLKKAINLRINVNKLTIKRKLLPSQTKGAPI